jgi:flagellar motor switch protein FliN/FliY
MTQAAAQSDAKLPLASGLVPVSLDVAIFREVSVELKARLGLATLSIEEVLSLKSGSVVKLDAKLNDLIQLSLNGSIIALGEIVAVGDHFGLRIIEVARAP